MYKTSTNFIKGQIPGTAITDLLQLYKWELEAQSVSSIQIREDILEFSNDTFKYVGNRYANKYASFTSGRISIEDNGDEYLVLFEADNSRAFTVAGIIAGVITLISLVSSNFKLSSFVFGAIIYVVIAGVGYGLSIVSFPVYFESLRNNIERRLQKPKSEI